MKKVAPNVLIFDSGVGGLSVFNDLHDLLPHLSYHYLFDNQAYPYGELEPETLIHRTNHLIHEYVSLNAIDLVVIACNTASTIVLPSLRARLSIPVVGVVPAIKPASLVAQKGVGLLATPATVTRQYTHDLIRDFAMDTKVELLGSTRLVDMAEDKLRGEEIDLVELKRILNPLTNIVDVIVLGCTHFPLIRDEINHVCDSKITLIDSGQAIARRVKALLQIEEIVKEKERTMVGLFTISCTAHPKDKDALDSSVGQLGFAPIKIFPLPLI